MLETEDVAEQQYLRRQVGGNLEEQQRLIMISILPAFTFAVLPNPM